MVKKGIITFILVLALTGMIFLTSPESIIVVVTMITLTSIIAFFFTSLFLNTKRSVLAAVFVLVLLTLNYVIGFNLLNTILLLCFIIGLSLL